uniref:Ribosomal RNA-processing protein 7 C-terminal domain-containing protein n=1 Tax=Panagrolaimus sp. PS1159 TaxID=55785 RepID=A0AC35FUH6_9BILA
MVKLEKTKITKKVVKKKIIKKAVTKKPEKVVDFGVQNDNVVVLRYAVSDKFSCERNIFLKRQEDNDKGITVSNIPAFISDTQVKTLLEHFIEEGKIISAFVKRRENVGFRVMVVYFESEPWLQQLFKMIKNSKVLCLESLGIGLPITGFQKYCMDYNNQFKSVEEMRHEVENTVAAYDEHLKERKDEFKRTKEEALDEEGWTKVTKGHKRAFRGRKGGISNKSVVISKKKNKTVK